MTLKKKKKRWRKVTRRHFGDSRSPVENDRDVIHWKCLDLSSDSAVRRWRNINAQGRGVTVADEVWRAVHVVSGRQIDGGNWMMRLEAAHQTRDLNSLKTLQTSLMIRTSLSTNRDDTASLWAGRLKNWGNRWGKPCCKYGQRVTYF